MALTITLRHLQHFRMVAEEQNLHRAAQRIPTDPSSLSRTIHELEYRLGVELFVRDSRGVRITPAGEHLRAHSDELLGNFEQVVRSVQEMHARRSLPLRVGIADGLAQPLLSQRLAQWRAIAPKTDLEIIELRASELATGLRREEIDVGFSFGVAEDEAIVQEAIWSYPLVVLVPSAHPLAARAELAPAQVVEHPLVVCDPHYKPGVHRQIDMLIRRHTSSPVIADQASSLSGFITKISVGAGIGLADAGHMLTVSRPDIVSIPLRDETASLTTYVLHRRRKSDLPQPLASFIAHMKTARS
jgi:DNA-binding transcriptional LysR family regulator